ncbi:MAG: hypothetical protein ACYTXA_15500 [Nostoc sp.]
MDIYNMRSLTLYIVHSKLCIYNLCVEFTNIWKYLFTMPVQGFHCSLNAIAFLSLT